MQVTWRDYVTACTAYEPSTISILREKGRKRIKKNYKKKNTMRTHFYSYNVHRNMRQHPTHKTGWIAVCVVPYSACRVCFGNKLILNVVSIYKIKTQACEKVLLKIRSKSTTFVFITLHPRIDGIKYVLRLLKKIIENKRIDRRSIRLPNVWYYVQVR